MSDHAPKFVTVDEVRRYVASRGALVEDIMSDPALTDEPARLSGLELRGPRGSKHSVFVERDGLCSFDTVKLWCDGIDYSSNRIRQERARKAALRNRSETVPSIVSAPLVPQGNPYPKWIGKPYPNEGYAVLSIGDAVFKIGYTTLHGMRVEGGIPASVNEFNAALAICEGLAAKGVMGPQ